MKVALIVHDLFGIGGVEEAVKKLSLSLFEKKNPVIVIAFSQSKGGVFQTKLGPVRLYTFFAPFLILPGSGPRSIVKIFRLFFEFFKILPGLAKVLKKEDIELINVHYTGVNSLCVWLLSFFCKTPYIITLHGFTIQALPFLTQPARSLVYYLYSNILKRSSLVTAPSKALLLEAQKLVPQIANKSAVISNGVDANEFRHNGQVLIKDKYIFSMGRFHEPFKGFDVLLFAFKKLVDDGFNIRLVLAGSGESGENYKKITRLLGLDSKVVFFGKADRKEVSSLFNHCEFFVLPSRIEPFGIVSLEAMAAGKAVVATDTGGVAEVVGAGQEGLLAKPNSDLALFESMRRLLKDQALRISLEQGAKKKIDSGHYSWQTITDSYLEAYEWCINKRKE